MNHNVSHNNRAPIKVSVIVPVYNAGEKLHRCLGALERQTLSEMEFILVLDCPTDGSDLVAKSYAQRDSRFVLVHNTENLHIGMSRNRGMDLARGEYIGFCDHDDDCVPDMYEKLYQAAKASEADVCLSYLLFRYPHRDVVYPCPTDFDVQRAQAEIVASRALRSHVPCYNNIKSVWLHLFKTSFLRRHQIYFVDTKKVSIEDNFFCAEVYLCDPRVAVVPEVLYHWYQDEGSTINTYEYSTVDKLVNFSVEMYRLVCRKQKIESLRTVTTESIVRRLYTSFRRELKRMGWKAVPYFKQFIQASPELCRFLCDVRLSSLRTSPPTKVFFYYCILKPAANKICRDE